MDEQKEIRVRDLNDDDYLTRVTSNVPLTCNITAGGDGYGCFSKELVSKLMITMKRAGHNLTDLFIGPEDMDDIREWADDTVIDPTTSVRFYRLVS